jgi:integrase
MIYKRGKTYWYEFVFNGRRYRGTTDIPVGRGIPGDIPPKEKAKQIENAKRHKLAMEAAGIPQPDPPPMFSDFSTRFIKWVSAQRAEKPRTVAFYRTRVGLLQKFDALKNARLDEVNGQLIAQYVEWRKGCARTKVICKKSGLEYAAANRNVTVCAINRELAVLRRMLRVAREWSLLSTVPVIHLLPGERQSDRILTHTEEDIYLTGAPLQLRQFATIALDTGMRPEEILRLRWENVHFEPVGDARFGYLHNPYGKTAKARRNLPMTARVKALLEMLHEAAAKPNLGYVFLRMVRSTSPTTP